MKKKIVIFLASFTLSLLIFAFNPLGVLDELRPFINSLSFTDYIISFLLFFLFLYVSVCIHEFGHAFFAIIAGLRLKKIQIGISDPLVEINVAGVRFVVAKGIGGYIALANPPETWLKSRLFITMAGGVSANLFTAILTISIFEINLFELFSVEDLTSRAAIGFAIINLFFFAVNLLPMPIFNYGFLTFSDGQQLLKIPGCGPTEIADALAAGDIWDGYEKIKKSEFIEAEEIFLKIEQSYPESVATKINLSIIYLAQLKIEKARFVLNEINNDQTPQHFRALVWHNYGWICLVEGTEESIAMALTYADKSLSVLHGAPIFRALKGVALVESGDTKNGITLLESVNVKVLSPDKRGRGSYFAFLAYGYWMQKRLNITNRHAGKVDEHYEIASAPDKIIIDRLRKKSNDFGRGDSSPSDFIAP